MCMTFIVVSIFLNMLSQPDFSMLYLVLIALIVTLIYLLHSHIKAKPATPPGPPRLPLIGNLHQFGGAGNLHVYLWKLSKKYGPIIHLKLGCKPVVVVSSAKLAKEVLKTQDLSCCSRPKLVGLHKMSYSCMDIAFTPYSDHWKELRKITSTNLFSLKKTQSFRPIREHEIFRMITKISSSSSSSSSSNHEHVVNLSKLAIDLSSSLICRIAFGKRFDEDESKQPRFSEILREAQAVFATFFVSDYFPAFSWVDKISGSNDWLDSTHKKLDSFYQELIDEHLDPKREKKTEKDIIDILINLKQDKSFSHDIHIKPLLMNIIIGATDTTAATIVWMMTALIKAPRIMKKLQQEIRDLAGKKGRVDEDDLPHLQYLKAVMKETFRMYPTVPMLVPRETIAQCTLEGYQIQPKTMVYVNAWAVARDPEYWENPDEFVPERFLNSDIDVKGQDFGLIPFGSGRRMCPGMPMGLVTVEMTVANLLYSFDWDTPRGVRIQDIDDDTLPGITTHKKNPLLLVPKNYIP